MTETFELSLQSQAKLVDLSASLGEFFESFEHLKGEVAELKAQVSTLENRLRLIELENAIK